MNKWNPNSAKHKAQHCGYNGKPSKGQIKGLLDLYSACATIKEAPKTKKEIGIQLKLNF